MHGGPGVIRIHSIDCADLQEEIQAEAATRNLAALSEFLSLAAFLQRLWAGGLF
jgi:hypothetical protein